MWRSDIFSSLEDKVILSVKGYCECGVLSLFGITEKKETKLVYREELNGEFNVSYEFDPVSLAVYSNIKEFYAEIDADCSVNTWSVTENKAENSGSVEITTNADVNASFMPKKVLFVGNSILLGMFSSYGMCATDNKNDYAYFVSQKILERSPDCTFSRLFVSPFEHAESKEAFEEWFYELENSTTKTKTVECFTEDLDLIILQIMDNVNTPEKKSAFMTNAPELLKRIKTLSPKARILWVYGWFMKPDLVSPIQSYCDEVGAEYLDVSALRCKECEAYSGQVSTSPSGDTIVVKDTWITHPGNLGMKKMAELISKKLLG